jgi:hypothetical protein
MARRSRRSNNVRRKGNPNLSGWRDRRLSLIVPQHADGLCRAMRLSAGHGA